jgi:hypothetical protein
LFINIYFNCFSRLFLILQYFPQQKQVLCCKCQPTPAKKSMANTGEDEESDDEEEEGGSGVVICPGCGEETNGSKRPEQCARCGGDMYFLCSQHAEYFVIVFRITVPRSQPTQT